MGDGEALVDATADEEGDTEVLSEMELEIDAAIEDVDVADRNSEAVADGVVLEVGDCFRI